jgi:hypothetical protein
MFPSVTKDLSFGTIKTVITSLPLILKMNTPSSLKIHLQTEEPTLSVPFSIMFLSLHVDAHLVLATQDPMIWMSKPVKKDINQQTNVLD